MTQFEYVRLKQVEIDKLKSDLEWYIKYASYVANASFIIDAEACSYADEDYES